MAFTQNWSNQQIGNYCLLHRLGAGNSGEVYLAEDLREHNQVAVKLMKTTLTGRESFKAFLNEASSMRLRHPHILPLLNFGLSEQDLPFLVMEYVPGGTLRDRYPKGSKVPLETVVDLATQLASALQYAHDHYLVHRDVKPENMLCRTDGTVLLSDFGIASVAHASSSVDSYRSIGGTLPYMAPEQHMGKPQRASDQYALAVVVYEWLAGVRPFQGTMPELVTQHLYAPPPSLRNQISSLPATVEDVVFKALSKEPRERFPCVEDFALALQATYQQDVIPLLTTTAPSQHATLQETHRPIQDQAAQSSQAKEDFAPPLASPVSPSFMEAPAIIQSVPKMITSAEVPISPLPSTPALVSNPVQPKGAPNRRVLLTLLLVLLIALSGGSLFHFGFIARTPTPAPVQDASATEAAQAYATGTTKRGVMFGFDAAHTRNNPYERTLSPSNISQLKLLWSFATGDPTRSSPAVADGMVYVGSDDGKLYAFGLAG